MPKLLALASVVLACSEGGARDSGSGGSGGATDAAGPPMDPPPVSTDPGASPAAEVDPFIGTGDAESPAAVINGATGATFPGAALPFGLVQLSPDTPFLEPHGYHYDDREIVGFSATHLSGAGCSALRDAPLFPSLEPPTPGETQSARFSHDNELASPGFYQVLLDTGILVDLTATRRTGLARFTFPEGERGYVTLLSGHRDPLSQLFAVDFSARIATPNLLTGSQTNGFFCVTDPSARTYFAIRFDRDFDASGLFDAEGVLSGVDDVSGQPTGAFVEFDTAERRVVHAKIGISFVSVEGALSNLDAENPDWDFDAVHQAAIDEWNRHLGRIEIEGGSDADRTSFYTALYHTFLQPAVFQDVDGRYVGFDDQLYTASEGDTRRANFSGWDVYRSWIQLVSVLAPTEASELVRSLIGAAAEGGALPKWSLANRETGVMVGDPADPTIASAWAFGARDFDPRAALDAMLIAALDPSANNGGVPSRPGLPDYLALGYVPDELESDFRGIPNTLVWGTAATTMEYALADFSIARMAEFAGDPATRDAMLARGRNWQNVFDAGLSARGFTGYPQPRFRADAAGAPSFDRVGESTTDGFVEGNATQYTFMVPHDVPGLSAALGGDAAAIARLDDLFSELNAGVDRPHFYMGNEPQFGTPWLYAFLGAAPKTQAVVRRIARELYTATPGGLPGNEDLGATSSWLVWAMLGIYPAIPGVGGFVVGSPLFPRTTVTLPTGAKIVIEAEGAGPDTPYVSSLTVDGVPTARAWIDWSQLERGADLRFVLSDTPNPSFGARPEDRPPSMYP